MKILFLVEYLQVIGGVETYLKSTLTALSDEGVKCGLVYESDDPKAKEMINDNANVEIIGKIGTGNLMEIICKIDNWKPNLVYCHGNKSGEIEKVLLEKYTCVLFVHDHFFTCISGKRRFIWPHFKTCEKPFDIKCLVNFFPRGCGGRNPLNAIKTFVKKKKRIINTRKYSSFIVASSAMKIILQKNLICPELINLIPYFPPDLQYSQKPPGKKQISGTILLSCRIVDDKGWKHACLAVKQAGIILGKSLRLVVAGEGPAKPAMIGYAKRKQIDCEFLGWCDRVKIADEIKKADIILMPSLWAEPFGLIGIEAGCYGVPAVGYSVGGIKDWLIPGVTGECGPDGVMQVEDLIKGIVKIFRDPDYLHHLGVGAWNHSKKFSKENHVNKLIKLFNSLIP